MKELETGPWLGRRISTLLLAMSVTLPVTFLSGQTPAAPQVKREADKYEYIRAQSDPEKARAKWFDSVPTSGQPIWAVEGGIVSLIGEHNAVLLNPPSYATYLQSRCAPKGVTVVVGRATSSRTLMNKSETFLFTDYTFSVDNWICPASGSATIMVSMLGGVVTVLGRELRAHADDPLQLDRRYVLLLDVMSDGGPYRKPSNTLLTRVDFERGFARSLEKLYQPPQLRNLEISEATFVADLMNTRAICPERPE